MQGPKLKINTADTGLISETSYDVTMVNVVTIISNYQVEPVPAPVKEFTVTYTVPIFVYDKCGYKTTVLEPASVFATELASVEISGLVPNDVSSTLTVNLAAHTYEIHADC